MTNPVDSRTTPSDWAERLGRTPDLSTFVEFATAIDIYYACENGEPGYPVLGDARCPRADIVDTAVFASQEYTPPTPVDPDTVWRNAPPESRSLEFEAVPDDIAQQLVLLGVHVEFVGEAPGALYSFRCALGVSRLWGEDGLGALLPVSACRESPLQLTA